MKGERSKSDDLRLAIGASWLCTHKGMQAGMSLVSGGWAGCFTVPICSAMILFGWGYGGYAAPTVPPAIRSIGIVLDQGASPVEQRVAGVIKNRILSVTPVTIEVGSGRKPGADLYIHLG